MFVDVFIAGDAQGCSATFIVTPSVAKNVGIRGDRIRPIHKFSLVNPPVAPLFDSRVLLRSGRHLKKGCIRGHGFNFASRSLLVLATEVVATSKKSRVTCHL